MPLNAKVWVDGRDEAVEMRKRRRLAVAQIGEQDAVLLDHRIGLLLDVGAHPAALRLGRRLEALAGDVEQPAVERAAQAAVFEPPIGEIGAAMRTAALDQAVAALAVAEHHEVLAEQAHRLDRPVAGELVDQRRRLPVAAHQGACGRAGSGPGDQVVLLGAQHGIRPSCPLSLVERNLQDWGPRLASARDGNPVCGRRVIRRDKHSGEAAMHTEAGHQVETAVEARAGFLDRPVLVVLCVSTVAGRGGAGRDLARLRARPRTEMPDRRSTTVHGRSGVGSQFGQRPNTNEKMLNAAAFGRLGALRGSGFRVIAAVSTSSTGRGAWNPLALPVAATPNVR